MVLSGLKVARPPAYVAATPRLAAGGGMIVARAGPLCLALLGSVRTCQDLCADRCSACQPDPTLSPPHLVCPGTPKNPPGLTILVIAYLASQPAPTLLSPSFACSKVSKISYPPRFTIPKIAYRPTNILVLGPFNKKHIKQDGEVLKCSDPNLPLQATELSWSMSALPKWSEISDPIISDQAV